MTSKTTPETTTPNAPAPKAATPTANGIAKPTEKAVKGDDQPGPGSPPAKRESGTPTSARQATRPKAAEKPARSKSTAKAKKPVTPADAAAFTVEGLAKAYIAHLDKLGKSPTTQISYAADLMLAIDKLGADTRVESLTPARIIFFFECDAVTKTRSGRRKARPTILKTRRVLRQALTWAAEQGLIAKAPEIDRKAETAV